MVLGAIPEIAGKDGRRGKLEGLTVTFGFGHAQFEIPVVGGSMSWKLRTQAKVKVEPNSRESSGSS